ncbi:MAG: ThiF family adenylyltransferase [Dehalococcoidia bacterium]|nr:ThiF family adenylyltransferase [Dehalococcoidia bacterium]
MHQQARLFIAGAGGLGSPVAMYLTAAGIGTMRIVDYDRVELGNLLQTPSEIIGILTLLLISSRLDQITSDFYSVSYLSRF